MQNSNSNSSRRSTRILLALVLGLAAAGGVYLYVGNVQQTAQQSARVAAQQAAASVSTRARIAVAKISIPAQAPLSPDNAELRELPTEAVQPNAVKDLN